MTDPIDEVEVFFEAEADLGEGPYWDEVREELGWVDICRGEIHTLDRDRRHGVITLDETVGSAVPLKDGSGWIAGVRSGVVIVGRDGTVRERVAIDSDRTEHRMNDGACDSMGRFWTGTKNDEDGPPSDSLYRVDTDLSVTEVLTGIGLSNGIGWSPDDRWMYFVDSAAGTVTRYPFDAEVGALGSSETFVEVEPASGEPDGIAIDDQGGVWVAIWDGSRVDRFEPDGRLSVSVSVPTTRPTSCALVDFGDGAHLYVTSAQEDDPSDRPAGAIFRTAVPYRAGRVHLFG